MHAWIIIKLNLHIYITLRKVEKVLQSVIQLNLGKMFRNLSVFISYMFDPYCISFVRNHNKFSTITVFVSFKWRPCYCTRLIRRSDCVLITKYAVNHHFIAINRDLKFGFEIRMKTTYLAHLRESNLPPRLHRNLASLNFFSNEQLLSHGNEYKCLKSRCFANRLGSISVLKLTFLRY